MRLPIKKAADSKTGRLSAKIGAAPGTPIFVGEQKVEHVSLSVINYDQESVRDLGNVELASLAELKTSPPVSWINMYGIHDVSLIEEVGRIFELHPLTLEDIVNTSQRPKLEVFDDYIYVVLKMVTHDAQEGTLHFEQVSLVLGRGWVLSFQEREGDVFDPLRKRIRNEKSQLRKSGSDYLLYALIDAVVDHYFLALEAVGEQMESLDDAVFDDPDQAVVQEIQGLKRSLLALRKVVWPLREEISLLERSESELLAHSTSVYLRDLYDHTIQVIETVETYRESLTGMHEMYLSMVSHRMNEVMKVLTIIATIFIPLTFLVGIYGMNFENIPELKWESGYFVLWGVMAAVTLGLIVFFKKKKWL